MEVKPFLRWAGGKYKLVDVIYKFVPQNINHYWEPFLGAGSLFFKLSPLKATLSDLNKSLIECYRQIQLNPEEVSRCINEILINHSEDEYYKTRHKYNSTKLFDCNKAAMFIYLNKTCFNGMYRVNTQNQFNVPYGKIINPAIPSKEDLINVSNKLANINLSSFSYEQILKDVSCNDFVYLDPPYPPISNTSKFVDYTKEKFTMNDQQKVALFASDLSSKGCKIMISNANTPFIVELYKDWNIHITTTNRTISCKKERYKVEELIITNY